MNPQFTGGMCTPARGLLVAQLMRERGPTAVTHDEARQARLVMRIGAVHAASGTR